MNLTEPATRLVADWATRHATNTGPREQSLAEHVLSARLSELFTGDDLAHALIAARHQRVRRTVDELYSGLVPCADDSCGACGPCVYRSATAPDLTESGLAAWRQRADQLVSHAQATDGARQ